MREEQDELAARHREDLQQLEASHAQEASTTRAADQEAADRRTAAAQDVFPDAVCVSLTDDGNFLTAIYSDHSFYVWDIKDTANVGKHRSALAHAGSVWDVEVLPRPPSLVDGAAAPSLPAGCFATCSADSTVRLWSIDSSRSKPPQLRGGGRALT